KHLRRQSWLRPEAGVGDTSRIEDVERENIVRAARAAVPLTQLLEVAGMLERRIVTAHARRARDLHEAGPVVLGHNVKLGGGARREGLRAIGSGFPFLTESRLERRSEKFADQCLVNRRQVRLERRGVE